MPAHSQKILHHISKRKRASDKKKVLYKFPAEKKSVRVYDNFMLILATLAPFFTLPQIIEIFVKKTSEGVSLFSWAIWAILPIFWFVYGMIHRAKPLIWGSIIDMILCFTVVLEILIF